MTKDQARQLVTELFDIARGDPGPNPARLARVGSIIGAFLSVAEGVSHMQVAAEETAVALRDWFSNQPLRDEKEKRRLRAAIMFPLSKLRTEIETNL